MPRINLSTGVTLDYFEHGHRNGIPVVLLHGWTDSWRIWEASFPYIADQLRIICPSHRGFGDSDKPKNGYAMRDFVEDCVAFVNELGLDEFALGGHSMGGFIAHHFAVENPSRLTHLILIGTGTTGRGKPAFTDEAIGLDNFPEPMTSEFARGAQQFGMRITPHQNCFDTVIFESNKSPTYVWKESWVGMQEEDHAYLLADIDIPTLIQCGDDDVYFPPAEQYELSAAISQSVLKLYPKVGHGLQWEIPELFARDLSEFILEKF